MNNIRYPFSNSQLGELGKKYILMPNHSVKFIHHPEADIDGECCIKEHTNCFQQDVNIKIRTADRHGVIVGHECRYDPSHKATDLSMMLIDQNSSTVDLFFYDIKETLHGIEVINHFAQQLAENIQFAKSCISAADAVSDEITIGVLIGLYSAERLKKAIQAKEAELSEKNAYKIGVMLKARLVKMDKYKELSNAKNVLNGQIELAGKIYDLNIHAFATADSGHFDQLKSKMPDTIIHNIEVIADDNNQLHISSSNYVLI